MSGSLSGLTEPHVKATEIANANIEPLGSFLTGASATSFDFFVFVYGAFSMGWVVLKNTGV